MGILLGRDHFKVGARYFLRGGVGHRVHEVVWLGDFFHHKVGPRNEMVSKNRSRELTRPPVNKIIWFYKGWVSDFVFYDKPWNIGWQQRRDGYVVLSNMKVKRFKWSVMTNGNPTTCQSKLTVGWFGIPFVVRGWNEISNTDEWEKTPENSKVAFWGHDTHLDRWGGESVTIGIWREKVGVVMLIIIIQPELKDKQEFSPIVVASYALASNKREQVLFDDWMVLLDHTMLPE